MNDVVLPTKRHPVAGELSGLEESKESQSRTSVVRNEDRDLLRRIIISHNRQGGVNHPHRRLVVGICRANKHVDRRKITLLQYSFQIVWELLTIEGTHTKILRCEQHESEDEVGDEQRGRGEEGGEGCGVEEEVISVMAE